MKIDKKKIAAAISAVNLYLAEEKALAKEKRIEKLERVDLYVPKDEILLKEIRSYSTGWAFSGRMQSMAIRNYWQLKLYK